MRVMSAERLSYAIYAIQQRTMMMTMIVGPADQNDALMVLVILATRREHEE